MAVVVVVISGWDPFYHASPRPTFIFNMTVLQTCDLLPCLLYPTPFFALGCALWPKNCPMQSQQWSWSPHPDISSETRQKAWTFSLGCGSCSSKLVLSIPLNHFGTKSKDTHAYDCYSQQLMSGAIRCWHKDWMHTHFFSTPSPHFFPAISSSFHLVPSSLSCYLPRCWRSSFTSSFVCRKWWICDGRVKSQISRRLERLRLHWWPECIDCDALLPQQLGCWAMKHKEMHFYHVSAALWYSNTVPVLTNETNSI